MYEVSRSANRHYKRKGTQNQLKLANYIPVYRAVSYNAFVGAGAHDGPAEHSTNSPKANAKTQHLSARGVEGAAPYRGQTKI